MKDRRISKTPLLLIAAFLIVAGAVWQEDQAEARQRKLDQSLVLSFTSDYNGNAADVQDALNRGASPNARRTNGLTPTLRQSVIDWWVKLRRQQPAADPNLGQTGLFLAAHNGHMDVMTALLDKGANINARNDNKFFDEEFLADKDSDDVLLEYPHAKKSSRYYGATALMAAAGNTETAMPTRLLLNRGADVNAVDEDGDTALINAAAAYKDSTLDDPLSYPQKATIKTLQALLDSGADVNARDRWGRTALMLAAEAGDTKATQLLLARGAEMTPKDAAGHTAFARAAMLYHYSQMHLLKKYGVTH